MDEREKTEGQDRGSPWAKLADVVLELPTLAALVGYPPRGAGRRTGRGLVSRRQVRARRLRIRRVLRLVVLGVFAIGIVPVLSLWPAGELVRDPMLWLFFGLLLVADVAGTVWYWWPYRVWFFGRRARHWGRKGRPVSFGSPRPGRHPTAPDESTRG